MNKTILKVLVAACSMLSLASNAMAERIIHYDNLPVLIELVDGKETSIRFGDHVQVGISKGQELKRLFRVQSAQGVVMFKPYQVFDKQRVQVKRVSDGRVILLDLVSSEAMEGSADPEVIRIILESENVVSDEDQELHSEQPLAIITPVDLTRYLSQRLYGPTRLHKDIPGITETTLTVDKPFKLFKGPNKLITTSTPIQAVQGGGYYASGVHIKNTSSESIKLNYLDINVPFNYATFQHHSLSAKGTPGDSTTLYLISDKPLKDTLYPWTYYMDIKAEAERQAMNRQSSSSRNKYDDDWEDDDEV